MPLPLWALFKCLAVLIGKTFSLYSVGICPISIYDYCLLFSCFVTQEIARPHVLSNLLIGATRSPQSLLFSRLNAAPSASSHTSHAPTPTVLLVPTRLAPVYQYCSCSGGHKISLEVASEHSFMDQRTTYQQYLLC